MSDGERGAASRADFVKVAKAERSCAFSQNVIVGRMLVATAPSSVA